MTPTSVPRDRRVADPVRVIVTRQGYATLTADAFGLDRPGVLGALVERIAGQDGRVRVDAVAGARAGDFFHAQLVCRHLDANGDDDLSPRMSALAAALAAADGLPFEGRAGVTTAVHRVRVTGPHETAFLRDVLRVLAARGANLTRVASRARVRIPSSAGPPTLRLALTVELGRGSEPLAGLLDALAGVAAGARATPAR